ncbi:hypothetical protein Moror_11886 [Moniliophthora roreri MCA 2997]|uniref:Reverse transcriptase-rnase h-integrase n=1 Tax=Moniliophthora roreri (strain MCA 2997) TaxID=1381753 RepID=V2X002_MONRO|nr:hypothetical protein Moror_11886 [Moniliophthora roreri MCA 2997]
MTPPQARLTALEESDLDDQLEVAEQLLNPNPEQTPCRITCAQQRGAIDSLQPEEQTEIEEPEAKSSQEPDPFNRLRNLYNSPSEPEMMTPGSSNAQWAATITTSVIETINDKKEDNGKPLLPEPFKGNQKDTQRFLLDLEVLFRMNPTRYNTAEKKKLILLLLLKGQT